MNTILWKRGLGLWADIYGVFPLFAAIPAQMSWTMWSFRKCLSYVSAYSEKYVQFDGSDTWDGGAGTTRVVRSAWWVEFPHFLRMLSEIALVDMWKKYPMYAQTSFRVQYKYYDCERQFNGGRGFQGELCKTNRVAFCTKISTDENAITNAVDIYRNPSGATRVMTANNDAQVRVMDAVNFTCLNRFTFPWSVNNTSVSPDGKLLAVLGDSPECLIADAQSGKVIGNLKGHLDYSFASAWHPDGRILATGNQTQRAGYGM
ncbi:UNVERIFIED_CONTAM: hypothetical protein Scaly_1350000 [Sesamum calycinum]|uniref:Uncharacterized protein n=1 Tax=Sesamum calycinum TaxID=2727403 RepID=A0AAW2PNR3_9LAMI